MISGRVLSYPNTTRPAAIPNTDPTLASMMTSELSKPSLQFGTPILIQGVRQPAGPVLENGCLFPGVVRSCVVA
jgi:hypothetical protein